VVGAQALSGPGADAARPDVRATGLDVKGPDGKATNWGDQKRCPERSHSVRLEEGFPTDWD